MTDDELNKMREQALEEVKRLMKELPPKDETDSLARVDWELGLGDQPPEEDAPVPSKKKPGPKGRSGGAAADL